MAHEIAETGSILARQLAANDAAKLRLKTAKPRDRLWTDEEVERTLTEVPGIGLWTARGFLLVALDRPDVFLSGDLALRRAIQRAYGFDHLPTEDEVAQVSDRWRPYRSLAVSYLFASEYDGQP